MKENTVEKEGSRDRRRRQSKRRRVEGAVAESISSAENALDSTVDDNSSNPKIVSLPNLGLEKSKIRSLVSHISFARLLSLRCRVQGSYR